MLSKEVSSTIFWVFSMTWREIEPRSPGPLANTLLIWPMARLSRRKEVFNIFLVFGNLRQEPAMRYYTKNHFKAVFSKCWGFKILPDKLTRTYA